MNRIYQFKVHNIEVFKYIFTVLHSHHHLLLKHFLFFSHCFLSFIFFGKNIFFKYFLYLFLERKEGREKERGRNINVWLLLACPPLGTWPATQARALTENQTSDPLVHRLTIH